MSIRIGINGFGRIGRCVLRSIFEKNISGVEVVAINGPAEISQHAHLFEFDSVHGKFNGVVNYNSSGIIINETHIPILRERELTNINWKDYNVDIVLECTGIYTSKEKASLHLKQGAKKVIISAPAKEKEVKTIVMGVNEETLLPSDNLISIGSCTTNCLAPLAKVLNETVGIVKGFMTTIHAYTGDQNILDASHKGDLRRARAAGLSMVPTSTGAAKALGLVLPELAGKLDGSAIRVPVPNVSVVDLCFQAGKNTTIDEINNAFISASNGKMKGVLGVESKPLVSTDFNHNANSSIIDLLETKVVDGNFVRVLSWYDNEWGFSLRLLDACKLLMK